MTETNHHTAQAQLIDRIALRQAMINTSVCNVWLLFRKGDPTMFRKYTFSITSIFVALIVGLFGTSGTSLARPVPPGTGAQSGGGAAPLVAVGNGFTYQGRLMF